MEQPETIEAEKRASGSLERMVSPCPRCGNNRQVWDNQITGKPTCHRVGCNLEIPLPCPFCGATKITVEWESCPKLDETDTTRRWFAECTQCSCQGPFCQKEPHVIPAWNKRANESSSPTAGGGSGGAQPKETK